MTDISLLEQAKELEAQVTRLFTVHDITTLPHVQKELVNTVKHQLVDARLDIRDFEYAQSRVEQLEYAAESRPRLEELHRNILKASEYGLLSAIDIAHVSARLQQLQSHLR
jgi:hypothetical protein